VVGYYNTPWSQASDPPVTSVDLDLPGITDHTLRAIDAVLSSHKPAKSTVLVKPVLVVRETPIRKK